MKNCQDRLPKIVLALVVVVVVAAASIHASYAFYRKAQVLYGINCNHNEAKKLVEEWYNHRKDCDGWHEGGKYVTSSNLITDSDKSQFGSDDSFVDNVDAVFIAEHGNYSGDTLLIASLPMPFLGKNVSMTNMVELGDRDLDVIHLYVCGGAQWIDNDSDGKFSYGDYPFRGWTIDGGFGGIGSVHGCHGSSYSDLFWFFGWHLTFPDGNDVSSLGDEESIANAWLDEVYDHDSGGNYDNCPISFSFGNTASESLSYMNKQYDFQSFEKNPVSRKWVRIKRISGCDPISGPALP